VQTIMLSFQEALAEDRFLDEPPPDDKDDDIFDGWEMDLDFFPETDLRPELRLFCGKRPDVTLRCRGGRTVQAHRTVLTEVQYFESLFNGEFKEREAQILDVDEDPLLVFEAMRWIYCRDAVVDKDTVLEVLRLGEFYGIEGLVEHCTRIILALGIIKVPGAFKSENLAESSDLQSDAVEPSSVSADGVAVQVTDGVQDAAVAAGEQGSSADRMDTAVNALATAAEGAHEHLGTPDRNVVGAASSGTPNGNAVGAALPEGVDARSESEQEITGPGLLDTKSKND